MEAEAAAVATHAGLLEAKGASWFRWAVVDVAVATARPRASPGRVGREHVVVEPELGAVGDGDRLVDVVERHHDHGPEELLLHGGVVGLAPARSVGFT